MTRALSNRATRTSNHRRTRSFNIGFEALEDRQLLTGALRPEFAVNAAVLAAGPAAAPSGTLFTPSGIRHAYGFDQVSFGSTVGDGTGQTIAIVVAYNLPTLGSDLHSFDVNFGLPDPPNFNIFNQTGGSNLPGYDSSKEWGREAALDVEYAHATAPKANILVVETQDDSLQNLIAGVSYARYFPGVSVVSMSWGYQEASSYPGSYDNIFTTPSGHTGITFIAATGDSGAQVNYPASSINVLAVGGTTLTTDTNANYISEQGWNGSGGGISTLTGQPSYQSLVVTQTRTKRTVPDVSMDADTNTGVVVYDSGDYGTAQPWIGVGGTSLSAPLWAGLMAVTNQGRAASSLATLDGPTGTLPKIYNLPAPDFHDITSGSNGYAAGTGYDLVTGRGTPIVNLVVRDLISFNSKAFTGVLTPGDSFTSPNGQYTLAMQTDGNLVEYGPNGFVFSSQTPGHSGQNSFATMQSDGNLTVYTSTGSLLFQTGTNGNNNAFMAVRNDGYFGIFQAQTNNLVWCGNDTAYGNTSLSVNTGQSLFSPNGQYQLTMTSSGVLGLFANGTMTWAFNFPGNGVKTVLIDGNLEVLDASNNIVAQTNTGSHPGAILKLSNTGRLAILYNGVEIWSHA